MSVASRPTSNFYNVQSSRSLVRLLLSQAKPSYVYLILKPYGQSSRGPVRPLLSEAKPSCVYSILKPHGKSFRRPFRPLLSEAKPSYVYSILKPHVRVPEANQTAAERGKAKLRTAVTKKIHPLITNPYVNEVTLRRQKPPLKCYYSLDFWCAFLKGLDLEVSRSKGCKVTSHQTLRMI